MLRCSCPVSRWRPDQPAPRAQLGSTTGCDAGTSRHPKSDARWPRPDRGASAVDGGRAAALAYVAATLGLDLATIAKAVEFDKPPEQRATDLDITDVNAGDLPHLIPRAVTTGNVLEISPNVAGLIGRTIGDLTFDPRDLASELTATITKPALLAALPDVDVRFRVVDEAGNPLVAGVHYFQGGDMFAPEFVLLPFIVEPAANAPLTVKQNFYCDVTFTFTPIGGAQEMIARTIGPLPVDLATIAIPFVAVLTEHAVGDSRFPGRVLVAVPENSPLSDAAAAFAALAAIRGTLTNVSTVLGLIGIGVPATITSALTAINTVAGLPVGRFRTGNLIGFFEWRFGIPPWDDWQGIFSAIFVFGGGARRAFTGIPIPFAGFSLSPSAFGVGAITDLSAFPLAPSVGTAAQIANSAGGSARRQFQRPSNLGQLSRSMSDESDARSKTSTPPSAALTPRAPTRVLRVVEDARRGLAPNLSTTERTSETSRVRMVVADARSRFRRRRSYAIVEDESVTRQ
jgi:hypothetical protein